FLTGISLNSPATLQPVFATNIFNYTATNVTGTTQLVVTVVDAGTVTSNALFLNGVFQCGMTSGVPAAATQPLVLGGNNLIQVVVIAQDGVTTNLYSVNYAVTGLSSTNGRSQMLMDSGWRFHLGDPADAMTNVTYYPEIGDLAKLDTDEVGTGTNTETY